MVVAHLARDRRVEAAPVKMSCVILTMGNRPAEFARAIASTAPLRRDGGDLVVVGNGAEVPPVPDGVTKIRLPENVGVAAAATRAWTPPRATSCCSSTTMAGIPMRALGEYIAGRFAADPMLAVVSFRVVDPAGGPGRAITSHGCGPAIRSGRPR